MTNAEDGITYPRDVPVEPGMPEGWKGIEKLYGPGSKSAGKVYCRYFSLDGVHRNVCSPKQVITMDCESKGKDPEPMIAEYHRLQKERHEQEAQMRKVEREAKGKLAGAARENAINQFRDTLGALSGPQVACFKDWVTRWHYQPNCDQVMVEYIDTEGNSWKLLKDLECAFQHRINNGEADSLTALIEEGKTLANAAVFAEGARQARETKGVYERNAEDFRSGGGSGGKVWSQEERLELRRQREEKENPTKKARLHRLFLLPEGPPQSGWAALEGEDDVKEAVTQFRNFLRERGFSDDTALVLVRGASSERKFGPRLSGLYVQLPELAAGQPCYQKLVHYPEVPDQIGCDGLYLAWSSTRSRWELSTGLRESRGVVAHASEASEATAVVEAAGPWMVQDGSGEFMEDTGLSVTAAPPP